MKRRNYINDGPTEEGKQRLEEAARLGLCPYHWTTLLPEKRVWCGKSVPVGPQDGPWVAPPMDCYWAFHSNPKWWRISDWKIIRQLVLLRDGKRCVVCGKGATEVDHIIEIQDGGAEFETTNLRSLCHKCHVRKTSFRRRYGPGPSVEQALHAKQILFEAEED